MNYNTMQSSLDILCKVCYTISAKRALHIEVIF